MEAQRWSRAGGFGGNIDISGKMLSTTHIQMKNLFKKPLWL
jgi:hypothetical protein